MPRYLVQWMIDVDEEDITTPKEAARYAQSMQQTNRKDYWCGVFDVFENDDQQLGPKHKIDLDGEKE